MTGLGLTACYRMRSRAIWGNIRFGEAQSRLLAAMLLKRD
jgi:hypothetical protein